MRAHESEVVCKSWLFIIYMGRTNMVLLSLNLQRRSKESDSTYIPENC